MTMHTESLDQRQVELEEESLSLGIARYEKARQDKDESAMAPGQHLLHKYLDPVATAIEEWVNTASTVKSGTLPIPLKWMRKLEPVALAYHVSRGCLATARASGRQKMLLQAAAVNVATHVEDELNYRGFSKDHPGYYKVMQKVVKKSTSDRHRRKVLSNAMTKADQSRLAIPVHEKVALGAKLIDIYMQTTGFFELAAVVERGKKHLVIRPTQELVTWLEAAHTSAACFHPVRLPMLVPPKDWSKAYDGGYLTRASGLVPLVRTRNKAYLSELHYNDMPTVFDALNAIQKTPWKINPGVLPVAEALWDAGGNTAGMPPRDLDALPPPPPGLEASPEVWRRDNPQEFKDWKKARAQVHAGNASRVSKLIATAQKVTVARRFSEEDAIYFPHNLDFRGRVYPVPPTLSPQGDDLSKSLLTFQRGERLGEDGHKWLAIHMANCYGVDKVSFEDRIQWVLDNEDSILDSALNPLDGERFWAKTDESPWCFLAACFEWAGYRMQGADYVSHLPVAMDGSCNGLQNFSAMLRDEVGGAATNLVAAETPSDIYTEVMDVAKVTIVKDAEEGDPRAIFWDAHMTRKTVKQPVMTLPYGVTRSGMRGQLLMHLRKSGMEGETAWENASYLAGILETAIGEVVIAAVVAMTWLKDAARALSADDMPIRWTTPVGFPVLQDYRDVVGQRVCVHIGGRRSRVVAGSEGVTLDRRRQMMGISPNFVHSCDASHMMMTVVLTQANGVTDFAMIHDSFATHAGKSGILAAALRCAFVEQYSSDVLGSFRDEITSLVPEEIAQTIPELPPSGSLDLNEVLDSPYFFA